jgi:hypothetical protein
MSCLSRVVAVFEGERGVRLLRNVGRMGGECGACVGLRGVATEFGHMQAIHLTIGFSHHMIKRRDL